MRKGYRVTDVSYSLYRVLASSLQIALICLVHSNYLTMPDKNGRKKYKPIQKTPNFYLLNQTSATLIRFL